MTGQPVWCVKILAGKVAFEARHCSLTGSYIEPFLSGAPPENMLLFRSVNKTSGCWSSLDAAQKKRKEERKKLK